MKKFFDWINNNKVLSGLLLVGVVLVVVPLAVYGLSVGTVFPNGGNDWSGFWGGYLGAIIGAAATVFGVVATLNETRRQTKVTLEETRQQFKEDKRIEHAPLLKIEPSSRKNFEGTWVYSLDEEYNRNVGINLSVKNIGLGPITEFETINFKFIRKGQICPFLSGVSPEETIEGIMEVGYEFIIPIVIGINLPQIDKDKSYLAFLRGEGPVPELSKSGVLSFDISYKDIFENKYNQHVELSLCANIDNLKKCYEEPVFSIRKVHKAEVIKLITE